MSMKYRVEYTLNKVNLLQISTHLQRCSPTFIPELSTYVDIPIYAEKIFKHAVTFEAWSCNELIGLLACYLNNFQDKEAFITNISVIEEYHRKGVASKLLDMVMKEARKKGFIKIILNVEEDNLNVISFYLINGFIIKDKVMSKYIMIKLLDD